MICYEILDCRATSLRLDNKLEVLEVIISSQKEQL